LLSNVFSATPGGGKPHTLPFIEVIGQAVHLLVQLRHLIQQRLVGRESVVHNAFITVGIRRLGSNFGGVVVLLFKLVLADAILRLKQTQRAVLVEKAAVSLGFHDPARAGGVG
jgi:hypothetical protein